MALTQMLVMPLFFLSGARYPLRSLTAWLTVLTRPFPGGHMGRVAVPVGVSLGIVAVTGAALLGMAIA